MSENQRQSEKSPAPSDAPSLAAPSANKQSIPARMLFAIRRVVSSAVRFERADIEEIRREWSEQWAEDKRELADDITRNEQKAVEIADDIRHPSRIVEVVEDKAEHVAGDIRHVAEAMDHPSEIVSDVREEVTRKQEQAAKTAADIASNFASEADVRRLPSILRVFGAALMVGAGIAIPSLAHIIYSTASMFSSGNMDDMGTSTIVVTFAHLGVLALLVAFLIFFGFRLVSNRRRGAALISYVLYVLLVLGAICSIMLSGITMNLAFYGIAFTLTAALQSYLDPSLLEERRAHRQARLAEERKQGDAGTLGRDMSGKGYITLNFFNLFWIFVIASVLGLFMEELYHVIVVDPGHWQDRAGLLFGPFSPIYGFGAVLMTLFLNRFHKSGWLLIFVVAAVIGGAFEAATSVFMQYAFGAVAWDYSNMPGALFGGRTCLPFMAAWGLLGLVWIKLLLPAMLRIVNFIPWNWRYAVTVVAACLMLVDGIMTLQSLDCWYERVSGRPIETDIQQFYAQEFDNTYMADRFQTMTITPDDAVRK